MRKKYFYTMLLGLSLSWSSYGQDKDIFEQIALQERQETVGLEENRPPILPDVILPWDKQPQSPFHPMVKMTTQRQLDAELVRMRKQYAPFMRNLAPRLPQTRRQSELRKFKWRLLASDMREDDQGNLYPIDSMETVHSDWVTVTIPHYTGPINHAEAMYRTTLTFTKEQLSAGHLYLHFNGVDYRTEVSLNGSPVGKHTGLLGAFEWDIKPLARVGKNILEVKVINEPIMMGDNNFLGPKRKFGRKLAACGGPGWDGAGRAKGWQNCPPGFGIWQRCYVETRPEAFIQDIFVHPRLAESEADVEVQIAGHIDRPLEVRYSLFGQNFQQTVMEKRTIATIQKSILDGSQMCRFTVKIPREQLRIWSPDEPWLYQLQVRLDRDGILCDARKQTFGMRSFEESQTSTPKGRFYLNGKEIKLRGANMMGNLMQCVIRQDFDQLRDDILLAKIAGMTFWRMTQQPCQEEVYDYFDQLGMLAQSDMPCFNGYRKDCVDEVLSQFNELMLLVRNHPCNAIISYCNEPDFKKPMMLNRREHVALFHTFDQIATQMNPGQTTKWIEGDYLNVSQKHSDHHCYDTWYGDDMRQVYFGGWFRTVKDWMTACGEFGAEGLDDIRLMRKYYPKPWLDIQPDGRWSPNQIPSCQTERTGKKWLQLNTGTMNDWVMNSRNFQMWGTRLFTEALRRNPKMNSFSIHLLIDAWPAGWLKSIMDTDRKAKPAYFAYKDALTPVAVNLRPDAFYGFSGDTARVAVFICNDTPSELAGYPLRYQVIMDGKTLYTGSTTAKIPAGEPMFQGYLEFPLPQVTDRKTIQVQVGLMKPSSDTIKHDSSYDLEVYPSSDKGKVLNGAGGYPQRLIQSPSSK